MRASRCIFNKLKKKQKCKVEAVKVYLNIVIILSAGTGDGSELFELHHYFAERL